MAETTDEVPLMGQGLTWESMTAGSAFQTAARTITESDLMSFVHVAGFTEPLFYDASHAADGGYTGRLVPGALVYVLAEGLILQTNVIHGTGLAFMHMEFSVKSPTYVGDTLHVVVTTLESRASSRPGRGVVTSRCAVINQHGTEVAVFTPVRLIRGRDFAQAGA